MSLSIHPAQPARIVPTVQLTPPDQVSIYDRTFFKLVAQLAIRVLFPFSVMWLVASVLPIGFSATILTGAVFSASFLAALFFQSKTFVWPKEPPSFLGSDPIAPNVLNHPIPTLARGINNGGNNCWLNATLQVIRLIPFLNQWIRDPNGPPALAAVRQFYNAYDASIQNGDRCVQGASSQQVRVALHQISNLITLDQREIDASEGLMAILGQMPDEMKGRIQETNHWDTRGLPPILNNPLAITVPINRQTGLPADPDPFISWELSLPEEEGSPHLNQMIRGYLTDRAPHEGVVQTAQDGRRIVYPKLKTERTIVQPPQALAVTIKRFEAVRPVSSLLSRIPIVSFLFPPQEYRTEKNEIPVTVPEQITLPTQQGPRQYTLKGIICHQGPSPDEGHYYALGKENGGIFEYNDSSITRADAKWESEKSQAYVLLFAAE